MHQPYFVAARGHRQTGAFRKGADHEEPGLRDEWLAVGKGDNPTSVVRTLSSLAARRAGVGCYSNRQRGTSLG